MNKAYQKVGWKNEPSVETPINDENLGIMDNGIDVLDDRIVELDNTKANQADYLQLQTVVSNQSQALSSAQEQISSLNGKTDQTNEAVNVLGQKTDGLIGDVENLKTQSDSIAENVSSLQEKAEETDEVLTAQGKVLKQTAEAVDNRIKKFYTNNLGENYIADSDDGYFRNIRIEGKSEQFTTTGAQLAHFADAEEDTVNGITWSCEKGAITAKGTSTSASNSSDAGIVQDITGMVGTYYISGSSGGVYVYVAVTKSNGTTSYRADESFVLDGTEQSVSVYANVGSSGKTVDVTVYPMLNAGETALPWEPYTGGQPSPSPDYPQEIKSADGMYTGKNKLPNDAIATTRSGVTFTVNEDGSITANGRATANIRFDISEGFKLPQGDYLLSGTDIYQTLSACTISDTINDGTGAINVVVSGGSDASIKVSNDNTTHNVSIGISSGKTVSNETIYPMIRPANTDSKYEPYTGGVPAPAPNKLVTEVNGKNLLPNNMVNATVNGVTFTKNEDDSITVDGISTERTMLEVSTIFLSAGAYIFSQGVYSDSVGLYLVYTENGALTYVDLVNSVYGKREFTLSEDKEVTVRVDVRRTDVSVSNMKLYPMLRPASIIDETYQPHVPEQLAPIPVTLRSVGEGENAVRDVMYVYADDTGKLVQNIGVAVFDGSDGEGWYSIAAYDTTKKVFMNKTLAGNILAPTNNNSAVKAFCTAYKVRSANGVYTGNDGISVGDAKYVSIYDKRFSTDGTLASWIAHLASNPFTFQYPLETPIETMLTAEQVQALFELRTHYGGTHISFESENGVEPTINFDYACSLENFVEYIKGQMGDDRKFVYDMEDRLTQENKALEQYLDALLGME